MAGETDAAPVEADGVVLVARRRRVVRVLDEVDLPDGEVVRVDPLEDGDTGLLPRVPHRPDEISISIPFRDETAVVVVSVAGDVVRRRLDVGAGSRVVVDDRVGESVSVLPIDGAWSGKAPVRVTHDLRGRLAQRTSVRPDRLQIRRRAGELRI